MSDFQKSVWTISKKKKKNKKIEQSIWKVLKRKGVFFSVVKAECHTWWFREQFACFCYISIKGTSHILFKSTIK